MAKHITFQFRDDLDYQMQAIYAPINLLKGLVKTDEGEPARNCEIVEGSRLLKNLREVQLQNNLFADDTLAEGNNFTIEMETGTGKTYVYLRTILELYREYGFKKFIIVVPSIAIRKGVEKSMTQLREHFRRLYDVDIAKHSFIYDSTKPRQISRKLVESSELSICVMNIQAFNKDTNRIRTEDEYGQIIWNEIQYIRPIVMIDEPQKMEGIKNNKSKSLKAIEELQPLFTLRYSATHKNLYNQIYKLDSYAAYQNALVKKIAVKTVHSVMPKDYPYIRYLAFTADLKAKIELFKQEQGGAVRLKTLSVSGGESLEELSGGLPQYRDMRIAEAPHKLKPLTIEMEENSTHLRQGHSNYEIEKNDTVRIQIRLAIQTHFDKQLSILKRGRKIKALTLFFVDAVDKVRDSKMSDGRGEYLCIFDDEYEKAIKLYEPQLEKYKEYFPDYQNVQRIREGYFAVDAKKNIVDVIDWDSTADDADVKIKAKSQQDIDRGISLILEKKDELISFDEPLAFIFSHSALREGWDNPNVFTICTLKAGGTEIAKKQEIGRGLRLPVDETGNRCIDPVINELTVIANDYYDQFAEALQNDFNKEMNFDKNEVTAEILITTLRNAGVPEAKITAELIDSLNNEFIASGLTNHSHIMNVSPEKTLGILNVIQFCNETLAEHAYSIKTQFQELMVHKGMRKISIRNDDYEPYENVMRAFISQEEFENFYQDLYRHLSKKTMYKCQIDKTQFIEECISELNYFLCSITVENIYMVEEGKGKFNDSARFVMGEGTVKATGLENHTMSAHKSDLEIVNYIMNHTMLPRLVLFRILYRIDRRNLLDNQVILDSVTQRIRKKWIDTKAQNVFTYEVIDGIDTDVKTVLGLDVISEEQFHREWREFQEKNKLNTTRNEYHKIMSKDEKAFAKKLEKNENVVLFTKLSKGSLMIDTPYGKYSPDWAVVCRMEGVQNAGIGLNFVVGTIADNGFQKEERNKIKCGKLYFKAVSESIGFEWVNGYEDFKMKFGVKDSGLE